MKWPCRFVSSAGYFFTEWFWVPESPTYETVFFLGWPTFVWWSEAASLWQKNVGPVYQQQLRFKGYDTAMHHTLKAGDFPKEVMGGLIPQDVPLEFRINGWGSPRYPPICKCMNYFTPVTIQLLTIDLKFQLWTSRYFGGENFCEKISFVCLVGVQVWYLSFYHFSPHIPRFFLCSPASFLPTGSWPWKPLRGSGGGRQPGGSWGG